MTVPDICSNCRFFPHLFNVSSLYLGSFELDLTGLHFHLVLAELLIHAITLHVFLNMSCFPQLKFVEQFGVSFGLKYIMLEC